MSLRTQIKDGGMTGRAAYVLSRHDLRVAPFPPRAKDIPHDELTSHKLLRTLASNPAGSTALNVNGSVTPVVFSFSAASDRTLVISTLRVLLNDSLMDITSAESRRFGDAAAAPGLTNGLLFTIVQGGVQTNLFPSPIKNIGDFLDGADDYLCLPNAIAANVDLLRFDIQFEEPIFLPVGSVDKIQITVQDNLTLVDLFQVVARGYYELD